MNKYFFLCIMSFINLQSTPTVNQNTVDMPIKTESFSSRINKGAANMRNIIYSTALTSIYLMAASSIILAVLDLTGFRKYKNFKKDDSRMLLKPLSYSFDKSKIARELSNKEREIKLGDKVLFIMEKQPNISMLSYKDSECTYVKVKSNIDGYKTNENLYLNLRTLEITERENNNFIVKNFAKDNEEKQGYILKTYVPVPENKIKNTIKNLLYVITYSAFSAIPIGVGVSAAMIGTPYLQKLITSATS